ncbi:MAG: LytR family transcriptional regulator, partial [Chloroflexus sp.]|nr:LytR family transcriptional regulator [Chloroflexus sp.]
MDRQRGNRRQRPPTLPQGSARERVALLRARRRQRWRWLVLIGGIVCVLLLAFSGVGWVWRTLSSMRQNELRPPARTATLTSAMFQQPFTVLLLGVDQRTDGAEGVRSDTLILAYI